MVSERLTAAAAPGHPCWTAAPAVTLADLRLPGGVPARRHRLGRGADQNAARVPNQPYPRRFRHRHRRWAGAADRRVGAPSRQVSRACRRHRRVRQPLPRDRKDPAAVTITTWRSTDPASGFMTALRWRRRGRPAKDGSARWHLVGSCRVRRPPRCTSRRPRLPRPLPGARRGRRSSSRAARVNHVPGLGCIATLDGPHQSRPHCGAVLFVEPCGAARYRWPLPITSRPSARRIVAITLCHSLNQRYYRVARCHATTSGLRAFDIRGYHRPPMTPTSNRCGGAQLLVVP